MGQVGRRAGDPLERIIASSRSYVASDQEKRFYSDLVRRLAARRRALGISQQALDARLGTSDGQVAKWESLDRLPGAFMMMCWACSLGVTLEVVRDGKGTTT